MLQLVIAATFQRSKNAIKIINTLPLLSFRHKKRLLVFIFKKYATLAFNLKNYVQRWKQHGSFLLRSYFFCVILLAGAIIVFIERAGQEVGLGEAFFWRAHTHTSFCSYNIFVRGKAQKRQREDFLNCQCWHYEQSCMELRSNILGFDNDEGHPCVYSWSPVATVCMGRACFVIGMWWHQRG